jgi:hypothetical protein
MGAFYSQLSEDGTYANNSVGAYDPFGTSEYFWQAEVMSIHACMLSSRNQQQGGR